MRKATARKRRRSSRDLERISLSISVPNLDAIALPFFLKALCFSYSPKPEGGVYVILR